MFNKYSTFIVSIMVILIFTIKPLDRTPLEETDYYKNTLNSIDDKEINSIYGDTIKVTHIQHSSAGSAKICRLVNEIAPNAEGECSLVGITPGGGAIILKKMFNRTAVDFDNNRYKWTVEDDSTESLIRLTAI